MTDSPSRPDRRRGRPRASASGAALR